MADAKEIASLKKQFRDAVLKYREFLNDGLDCGAHMQAVIRPHLGVLAQKANELGRKLKAIDPEFPTSWVPYPTGES